MPSSVGQALREARTDRGIELSEVERVTKIRHKYLQAIEDDRWELLPGEAYARGFLSTYAQFLGLDERELLAEFRSEHEPVGEDEPLPETMLPRRGVTKQPFPRRGLLVGGVVIAVLAVVLVVALGGGSDGGEDGTSRRASHGQGPHGSSQGHAATAPEAQAERSAGVSVKLRSTGTVWVCLLDHRGRKLVDGETLAAGEERGPFDGREFELGLGNGSIAITLDGEPVDVPSSSDPLGYRITEGGASELPAPSRPTCL